MVTGLVVPAAEAAVGGLVHLRCKTCQQVSKIWTNNLLEDCDIDLESTHRRSWSAMMLSWVVLIWSEFDGTVWFGEELAKRRTRVIKSNMNAVRA